MNTSISEQVQKQIDTQASSPLLQYGQNIEEQLFNSATVFLNKVRSIFTQIEEELKLAERMNEYRQQVINSKQSENIQSKVSIYYAVYRDFSKKLIEKKQSLNNFYMAMMEFHSIINLVLDQQVKMIFVLYNRGNPIIINENGARFIKPELRDGALNLRYSLSKKNIGDNKITPFIDSTQIQDLTTAYKETRWRFNYAKSKFKYKEEGKKKKSTLYVVMYEIPDSKWHGVSVSSLGDINQAYATFALNHLNEHFKTENIEQKVKTFLFGIDGIRGVFGVDNESGLLAGDAYINDKMNQQIAAAIKSDRASVMSINQILKLAEIIVEQKGKFGKSNLQEIKSYLHNKTSEVRNQVIENMDAYAKQYVDETVLESVKTGIHTHAHK